jgi:PEP-CTERM motif
VDLVLSGIPSEPVKEEVALKFASFSLLALCLTLAAIPAVSQTLYDNGPVNGNTDAWAFSGGFQNTQSFTANGTMTNFEGWFWLVPGESLTGVELSIGTSPFGNDIFDTMLGAPMTSGCTPNNVGYQVCEESWTFNNGPVLNGDYWLTLQNGTTEFGTQPFWDENSGVGCNSPGCPSTAMLNEGIGTIPSEAFTISGNGNTTVPEPSSIMLLGSGIVGLATMFRRKLF